MANLITPRELHALARAVLSPTHPEHSYDGENQMQYYDNPWGASGDCYNACERVHNDMPEGSHIVRYLHTGENENFKGDHFVHQVPTTDGHYIVDYTHRQFHARAPFPIVERQDVYESRRTMKGYGMVYGEDK